MTQTTQINAQVFAGWMGTLGDRFGRALTPAGMKAYRRVLSHLLTTEQFDRAAAIVFARFEYKGSWPAPEVFVEAVNPRSSPELDAATFLGQVRSRARIVGAELVIDPTYWTLPQYVRRAVEAVGGIRRCLNATVDEEPFLLRDFGKHLASAKDHAERSAIAGAPTTQQLEPSVASLIGDVAQRKAVSKSLPSARTA